MISATYYGARSNDSRAVHLKIKGSELIIEGGDEPLSFELNTLISTPPIGRVPQEIRLPDGGLVVLAQSGTIDELTRKHSVALHVFERNKLAWIVSLFLVPILIYFILETVIPATAKKVTPLIPDVVTVKVDTQVMAVLDKTMLEPSQIPAEKRQEWQQKWRQLLSSLSPDNGSYTLSFRASKSMGANAFALPGGSVVVTDQLFTLLEKQPEAIIAILLHEIGHVEHRHGLQLVAEAMATTLLMTYLFGDMEGLAELFTGSFLAVVQNQFSQQLEHQADEYSVEALQQLGLSAVNLADALTAIAKGRQGMGAFDKYFSSHPSVKSRVLFAEQAEINKDKN